MYYHSMSKLELDETSLDNKSLDRTSIIKKVAMGLALLAVFLAGYDALNPETRLVVGSADSYSAPQIPGDVEPPEADL